ncbi:MAG: hypothetical protein O3C40_03115 [Planctomycetota bacterium]|nr:hypothetical protein [Planctomycetota bacterium]
MRSNFLTTATLCAAFALLGCNQSTVPRVEPVEKVSATKPDWKLVTLHIDGFKKSKSGGT